MKYLINEQALSKAINAITLIARTNLFSPMEYSNQVVPLIDELNSLEEVKDNEEINTENGESVG